MLSTDILQGWESIKELILAKAPAAAKPLVQYIVRCKIRPNMAAALRYQVSLSSGGYSLGHAALQGRPPAPPQALEATLLWYGSVPAPISCGGFLRGFAPQILSLTCCASSVQHNLSNLVDSHLP